MRSTQSIGTWVAAVLPQATTPTREAATALLQALTHGFNCRLCQLARQMVRNEKARSNRQYLTRWLNRPNWDPPQIYRELIRQLPVLTRGWPVIPILVDFTFLSDNYTVLQFAVPFRRRALPILRLVREGRAGTALYTEMLQEGLEWLGQYLPGERSTYLLVGDRGFPSHGLIRTLQEQGWRYSFRIAVSWRMAHPEFSGTMSAAKGTALRPGMKARWFGGAVLGRRGKGGREWCESHVVWWWEEHHVEPWILVTSEPNARRAIRAYRKRFGIECEFRDVKQGRKGRNGDNKRVKVGNGVSWLMEWESAERVARLIVWVAVYEWRLAFLWLDEDLAAWGRSLQIGGRLSWMTITREWVRRNLERALHEAAVGSLGSQIHGHCQTAVP